MSWNRPSDAPQPQPKKPAPALKRGLLAGAIIVLGAGLAAWLLTSGEATSSSLQKKDRGFIKEVKPAIAPTNAVPKKPKFPGAPLDWDKPYPPQAYWPDGSLKQHSRYVHVITNKLSDYQHSIEEKTFKNGADQHIALLLNQEPGEKMLGEMKYGRYFVKSFLKSLETPIIVEKDDTEEVAAMKRAVIEAKKDLKRRYDAGEDIAEIMNQTSRELRELGAYREELEKQIRTIRKEKGREMTARDYKDLIGAANKMLEEHGCAPMKVPEMTLKHFELRDARRAAEKAAAAEQAAAEGVEPTQSGENASK